MDAPDSIALQQENLQLRTELAQLRQAMASPLAPLFATIVSNLVFAVDIWQRTDPDDIGSLALVFSHRGPQARHASLTQHLGGRLRDILPWVAQSTLDQYATVLATGTPLTITGIPSRGDDGEERFADIRAIRLTPEHLCIMVDDVTDRVHAAAAHQQLREQQETIRSQQESLMELSTPLIPITDHVVVMPLIGAIDTRRAQQVMESLLQGIMSSRVSVAIVDITGVPIVDTQVTNVLIQAARSSGSI